MFQKCLFAAATLFAAVEAALYYPPIISPAAGDVIAAGSNFTLKWNTTIPNDIAPNDVVQSTSEVRLAIYFPDEAAEGNINPVYEQWVLYRPNSIRPEPLNFYDAAARDGNAPGIGSEVFEMGPNICDVTGHPYQYAVVWYDSWNPAIFSGAVRVTNDIPYKEGGCA